MNTSSHSNGIFSRLTNESGQSIDIYENPSEHYAGGSFGSRGSPFMGVMRKMDNSNIDAQNPACFGKLT